MHSGTHEPGLTTLRTNPLRIPLSTPRPNGEIRTIKPFGFRPGVIANRRSAGRRCGGVAIQPLVFQPTVIGQATGSRRQPDSRTSQSQDVHPQQQDRVDPVQTQRQRARRISGSGPCPDAFGNANRSVMRIATNQKQPSPPIAKARGHYATADLAQMQFSPWARRVESRELGIPPCPQTPGGYSHPGRGKVRNPHYKAVQVPPYLMCPKRVMKPHGFTDCTWVFTIVPKTRYSRRRLLRFHFWCLQFCVRYELARAFRSYCRSK